MFMLALAGFLSVVLVVMVVYQHRRQRLLETRLQRSQQLFHGVFDRQFQFAAVLSPEGRLLEVSDSLELMRTGRTQVAMAREDVVGRLLWDTLWVQGFPQERAAWPERLQNARDSDKPVFFTCEGHDRYGELRLFNVALTAVRHDQQLAYFVLHAQDITGALRSETSLRETHAALEKQARLLTTTLGSISQGIFMIGEDGRVSTFNPRVCELLDLTPEFLGSRPTLQEITRFQLERGDFGEQAGWVETQARAYVAAAGQGPIPERYLRTAKDGRIIEVQTQSLLSGGFVRTFTDVTDYVKAEEARKRSNALLQATQSIAGVGGWEVDVLSRTVFWTDALYGILDTSPDEFVPTLDNTLQFFSPAWRSLVLASIENPSAQAQPLDLEVEMLTARGRRIWAHAKSELQLAQDRVVKHTWVIQDVTATKEAEAALRTSEELFRQVTSQVPGVVYRVLITPDGERHYSFVSDGVRNLYGIEPEEVLADGSLLHTFRHPDDVPVLKRQIQEVLTDPRPLAAEFRIILRDGTMKWVQMTSSAVHTDENGTLRNGVMIDITDLKRAEDALREQDALWKLALESTGDGVWDWNIQAGTEIFSRRCLDMYGFTEGELAERPDALDSRTHPDDVEQMNRDRQAHFDGVTPTYVNEHRILCKDGSWKWIMTRGMVISRDAEGKPLRMIGTHTDITSRKMAEALIWQQANFDALTGLPNRRMLRDRLDQDIRKSRREGLKLAVLFIDLDHFKEVNDTLGHDHGDTLLVEAASRIRQCVRETDTVARMGGDEFTVVVPSLVDMSRVERIVHDLLRSLETPFMLGDEEAFVSASVGITVYPDDANDIDDLLKQADQALYLAKDSGRNRFSYFTPALQEAAQMRARLANDLRVALPQGQFWVAYQPIVELATGQIYKAEALLRWQHPTRGLISPADFIPVAESSGLIVPMGDWVFDQAIRQVMEWRRTYHPRFQISVNKSPVQFHHRREVHQNWFDQLSALGLPGDSVVVEITEGLLLDASPSVTAQLQAFRSAGLGLSLDDFGTGYSSLAYLQNYDIDYLKIDQSFVRRLTPTSKDLGICKAIIVMAHELGLKVVAEGVETAEQQALLTAAGCDYGQGYLFARPMTAVDFTRFLAGPDRPFTVPSAQAHHAPTPPTVTN